VLVDAVPANGEMWFLGRVFAAAAREGLHGVVRFADATDADSWLLAISVGPSGVGEESERPRGTEQPTQA
jgi:hypothetical protein